MRIAGIVLVLLAGIALSQGPAPVAPPTSPSIPKPVDSPRTTGSDWAKPSGGLVSLNELEDYSVKTEKLIVNNFSLREDPTVPGQSMTALRVSACYRARCAESQAYCVMLVGLDGDRNVVWAGNLKGMTDPTSGVGVMQDTMLVPLGVMKTTVNMQVRVYAGDGGPRWQAVPVNAPACYPAQPGYATPASLSRY